MANTCTIKGVNVQCEVDALVRKGVNEGRERRLSTGGGDVLVIRHDSRRHALFLFYLNEQYKV